MVRRARQRHQSFLFVPNRPRHKCHARQIGRRQHIQLRLTLALEAVRPATIGEVRIVGDVKVDALGAIGRVRLR